MYIYTNFNLHQSVPRFPKIKGGIKIGGFKFFLYFWLLWNTLCWKLIKKLDKRKSMIVFIILYSFLSSLLVSLLWRAFNIKGIAHLYQSYNNIITVVFFFVLGNNKFVRFHKGKYSKFQYHCPYWSWKKYTCW